MIEFVLAAPGSGSGKTVMACALLAWFRQQGLAPCAFKCGPDYIDPMFHRAVLGVQSHNLDLFLADPPTVRRLYAQYSAGSGAVLCEGAMGLYDGVGGSTPQASAWHLAEVLDLPVLLVLRPKGASLTLAAQVRGLQAFRPNSHLAGILLNDCSPMLAQSLAPMLERETGLPVLGSLPHADAAQIESRHLGLYTAGEIGDLARRMEQLAALAAQNISLARLARVCTRRAPAAPPPVPEPPPAPRLRLAVARDPAFCFCYPEALDALRAAGAEPVFFSPLESPALPPNVQGLYLPGGYPELYARQLAENSALRAALRAAVAGGLPTLAECGGFLYLGQSLAAPDGTAWPMVGALPGRAQNAGRLVRFGYAHLTARQSSMLFRPGEAIPAHEFHHWDSTHNGSDLTACKPVSQKSWACGFVGPRLYAAFPHLYLAGRPQLARRFAAAAADYQKEQALCGPAGGEA